MTVPTTIRAFTLNDLDLTLRTADDSPILLPNLLLTLELADGTRGYGEAAPIVGLRGETRAVVRYALEAARTAVEGADVREWRRVALRAGQAMGPIGAARCALETAMLDALARHAGLPLWALFGGAATEIVTALPVTASNLTQAASTAKALAEQGARMLKLFLGHGTLAADMAWVQAVARAAPGRELILDARAGYSADSALELIALVRQQHLPLALFEQPVAADDLEGLFQVARWAGVPVAADEGLIDARELLRIWKNRAAQVARIVPMKFGLLAALEIATAARAAGMGLMIGGANESILATTVSACLAAGLGGFSYADLAAPLRQPSSPLVGGAVYAGDTLLLGQISAGHGVTPRY